MNKPAAVPLHAYQRKWFLDRRRFKTGMFARQTGKTFTTTLEIVDDCFEAESQGKRAKWVILSRGERQAKEAMAEGVKRHAQAYSMAIEEVEGTFKTEEGEYLLLTANLPGGSTIHALPANPDTARGFSANVFLDEFAFHKNSREIWRALFPVISAGWKLRVTSTPNGKGNKFYDLMTGKDSRWSRHIVDIYQAVKDGLPRDIQELKEALNDPEAWAQEFELQWLDEALAWLSYDLINSCESAQAGNPQGYTGGVCFIGNDIARHKHLWVAWVLEQVGDVLITREISVLRNQSFKAQDAELDRLMKNYRVGRLAMDETGMGEKPVEDAKSRYGDYLAEGVKFTGSAKMHLATLGKQKFEDRLIRIPEGDQEVRADLHSLRKLVTPAGNIRFDVEADGEASGSHADRAWALFLAIYAASSPAVIDFEALEQPRQSFQAEFGEAALASDRRLNLAGWLA